MFLLGFLCGIILVLYLLVGLFINTLLGPYGGLPVILFWPITVYQVFTKKDPMG